MEKIRKIAAKLRRKINLGWVIIGIVIGAIFGGVPGSIVLGILFGLLFSEGLTKKEEDRHPPFNE